MSTIYERIRAQRERLGLSQAELAVAVGYTDRSTIAKIEKGKIDIAQSRIKAFADALHTTPAYLMGWEDEIISALHGGSLKASDISYEMGLSESIVDAVLSHPEIADLDLRDKIFHVAALIKREQEAANGTVHEETKKAPAKSDERTISNYDLLNDANKAIVDRLIADLLEHQ